MSVKEIKNGYLIDFTLNHKRYRESIPAPHNKSAKNRILTQELLFKEAIKTNDKTIVERFKNSGIIQKAFESSLSSETVESRFKKWMKDHSKNWSHTTVRGYWQKYRNQIEPAFGSIKLTEFKPSDYSSWAGSQTLSGKTINEVRSLLLQVFNDAFINDEITSNPMLKTKTSRTLKKEPSPFSKKEIKLILERLKTPHKEYFTVAFYTGLRTGELLAMRWIDIDLIAEKLHVRRSISYGIEKEPKTKNSLRSIPLNSKVINALLKIQKSKYFDEQRVFIDPKTLKAYKNAEGIRKYVWTKALREAGVEYRCPYQTRHTFASMMLSDGENPMKVATMMGHSDWGMIRKVYGRWIEQD